MAYKEKDLKKALEKLLSACEGVAGDYQMAISTLEYDEERRESQGLLDDMEKAMKKVQELLKD